MKKTIKIIIAVLLVIAALVVAFYNFFSERTVTYFASIVAVCGTVAILISIIFKHKKNDGKEALPMKKKLMIVVAVIAVIAVAALAWRIGYAMHKSTDNLPELTMVADMDDEAVSDLLVGYRVIQLETVWGDPDEQDGMSNTWQIDDTTELVVTCNDKEKVISAEIQTTK